MGLKTLVFDKEEKNISDSNSDREIQEDENFFDFELMSDCSYISRLCTFINYLK